MILNSCRRKEFRVKGITSGLRIFTCFTLITRNISLKELKFIKTHIGITLNQEQGG